MNKVTKKSIWLLIGFLFLSTPFVIRQTFSANWMKKIQIQNFSSQQRVNIIVPIEIPAGAKGENFQIAEGSYGEKVLPLYRSNTTIPMLYTQIDLNPNEEKTVILTQKSNPGNQVLTPTTGPGTEYLFVNYKTAIVISTEDQNSISFFSSDGKMLNSDQKPIILGKGKYIVQESNTPKLMRILSEKPVYVYSSTLKAFSDLDSVEAGDSDTTTLYGNDLFFFTEKHLFISAYEKTKVSLYDSSDLEVWTGSIEGSHGIFKDDLKRGAYHLVSDHPLTIQFGYLDDENFSVLYGNATKINAYAFGDLMINALYPNTKVTLVYGNEKVTKKEYQFKQAGMMQIITLIEQFAPKNPEFIFVSITFTSPIQVFTFSSGNNFGGEYIPGKNGLSSDSEFSFVTLRVSKEFSKEQKNLIELIGLENNTNISATGAWKKNIVLQEKSNYVFTSNTPMEKVNLSSDKPFQVSQIHNYNTKGLFYWIPPTNDSSIQVEIGDQTGAAMIQNESVFKQNIQFLLNKKRFHDFFLVAKTPLFLPVTIFFSSILFLFLLLIVLVWIQKRKKIERKVEKKAVVQKPVEKEIETIKNQLFEEVISKPIQLEETYQKVEQKPTLPVDFGFPKISLPLEEPKTITRGDLYLPKIPDLNEYPIYKEPIKVVSINDPIKDPVSGISISQSTYLAKLNENKIVLDPGSANRLYIEGKLSELPNVYMVKSSSRKISPEVTEKIHKVDLSLQDLTKANVYRDSLSTFEEAGKALSLCKKLKITYYISSYKLPSVIQGIHVVHISDALKT